MFACDVFGEIKTLRTQGLGAGLFCRSIVQFAYVERIQNLKDLKDLRGKTFDIMTCILSASKFLGCNTHTKKNNVVA